MDVNDNACCLELHREQARSYKGGGDACDLAVSCSQTFAPVWSVARAFGLAETPRIAGGRQVVKLHLLSLARRPVQVTQDLANFWRSTYAEVKKDLKGRYPRHYWPDDPLVAEATARVKPGKQ
jgi:HrpA-like RNA helicase